jgi:hypothetical protein
MSENQAILEGYLDELKTELENHPCQQAAPVGHTPPFSGDLSEVAHDLGVVYEEARAGRYGSKALHTHLAEAYGHLATKFLSDEPRPVGADAEAINPALVALLIQLLPVLLDLFRRK